MNADLDTLATALYVRIDDELKIRPELVPCRPAVGIEPQLSDAELVTVAVMQALLGFVSETRFLRYAADHLGHLFRYLPRQSGYNKRLRKAGGLIAGIIRILGEDTSVWSDDTWLIDSTPIECGRSRETAKRSDLAGFAGYGYCASHTRYFWGVRLHLVCTPAGLPVTYAITNPTIDERHVARDMFEHEPDLLRRRAGQTLIADKGYASREFDAFLADHQIRLVRPTFKREPPRPGQTLLKPFRQIIESINDTLKGQLNLEAHGGRTKAGLAARIGQRILALTAAIWHNDNTRQPVLRSLTAYDH